MEWTFFDCAVAFLTAVLVLEIYLMVRVVLWLTIYKRQSIYWNAKEQQIKTRSGKCVLDSARLESMYGEMYAPDGKVERLVREREQVEEYNRRIEDDENEQDEKDAEWKNKIEDQIIVDRSDLRRIEAQLQCQAKCGHGKWVFAKKDFCVNRNGPEITGYFFKCSICGLEITKTENELKASEKEALRKLKLI